ncbi:hypothetical protein EIN_398170 [Entamoeba invadens IP1]|uniref:Acid phosphatase n=2 Tax=Entamoeba invadens TaxID=33085 RepID=A0A0A1UA33_ENTIV|nr:hypothetical protein EIN_398170 [Entamoeba invadens IP1]ELP91887.1 hypothetical protein EIN_398170 [Entamoeba invadens IP1]BAN42197.1 hypothetical protein, conserved [Entamoeba invadens]|eukprot:XP_004258658.1 hypothetical protein EIN_398170 [Entamoeba invadens IP1]
MLLLSLLVLSVVSDKTYCEVPKFEALQPIEGYTPVLLQMVFRHGDRSPWLTYKGDQGVFDCDVSQQLRFLSSSGVEAFEHHHIKTVIDKEKMVFAKDNMYSGSCQLGQLTRKGLNQLAYLGDQVRSKYVGENNFLPVDLDTKDIYVRSTQVWRVIQSAESFLQHLYPADHRKKDARIKIDTLPSEIEYAVKNEKGRCPYSDQLDKDLFSKYFIDELSDRNNAILKPIYEKMARFFGEVTYNWYDSYFDILQELECNDQPFPCRNMTNEDGSVTEECITKEEFDTMVANIYHDNIYRFWDNGTTEPFPARYASGWLLRDILNYQMDRINGVNHLKYTHFHAHDTTIYPLVSLLEGDYSSWPPYASYIIFELYEKEGENYIRVGYNNKYLDLNFCEKDANGLCKFKSFYDHLQAKVLPLNACDI